MLRGRIFSEMIPDSGPKVRVTDLAAAETWNVETLRSETWCPKRKPRNVTPYRSENHILGFQHVETWEPLSWALLTPPKKNWVPPQNAVISGVSFTKTPSETSILGRRGPDCCTCHFGPCFQVVSRSCRGCILFKPPPKRTGHPPQNVVISGALQTKPPHETQILGRGGPD